MTGGFPLVALIIGMVIALLQIGILWYLYCRLPVSVSERDGRLVIRVGEDQVRSLW